MGSSAEERPDFSEKVNCVVAKEGSQNYPQTTSEGQVQDGFIGGV